MSCSGLGIGTDDDDDLSIPMSLSLNILTQKHQQMTITKVSSYPFQGFLSFHSNHIAPHNLKMLNRGISAKMCLLGDRSASPHPGPL